MSRIATVQPDDEDFDSWEPERLRQELVAVLGWTADRLRRLARIWAALERKGEDLSALRSGLVYYLPLIASGQVLPEAVVRFAGSQTLLKAVTLLPIEQQRKLADGDSVKVVVKQGDGFTHRMLPVHALNYAQLKQVFADRSIRSETEQIALLSAPKGKSKPGKPVQFGKAVVDVVAGTVRIGKSIAAIEDVIGALRSAGKVE